MFNDYTTLAEFSREGFDIIVDKTWEDMPIADCFDDSCYDIRDMERRVNKGDLDWFQVRVRAQLSGLTLGISSLGGCMYERAEEILTDGVVEDLVGEAINEARTTAASLKSKLEKIVDNVCV